MNFVHKKTSIKYIIRYYTQYFSKNISQIGNTIYE